MAAWTWKRPPDGEPASLVTVLPSTSCVLQAVAQEARFACVRQLQECDGQQRYNFLEGAVQTLSAHIRNANRSSEVVLAAISRLLSPPAVLSQMLFWLHVYCHEANIASMWSASSGSDEFHAPVQQA